MLTAESENMSVDVGHKFALTACSGIAWASCLSNALRLALQYKTPILPFFGEQSRGENVV